MSDALPPLPEGWSEQKNAKGKVFYFNNSTKKSTWTRPGLVPSPEKGRQALPPGWTEQVGKSGKTFYYNEETGKSVWKRPTLSSHLLRLLQ